MEQKYEIVREERNGNLHRVYFRKKHQWLYGDYENYVISNEGRKNYYQVCYSGLNGLWFEMQAKTLAQILAKYGLEEAYRVKTLECAIADLKVFIEHAYERGCDKNHPQVKRFWVRLERAERELAGLKRTAI